MSSMKAIAVIVVVCILIISGLILSGWYFFDIIQSNDDEKKKSGDGNFNVEYYPRVDGSTSAHPLDMLVACKLLDVPYKWETYYDGTRRIVPDAEATDKISISENITDKVIHHGTHDAYVNLINDDCDLIMVARMPSQDELDLAEERSVELEIKAIALDAFVIIANAKNPVDGLTVEQLQKIYTGNITNWKEVGGDDANITAYQRNDNSGSHELMKELVMKDLEMIDAPEMMILWGMMGPYNKLSDDENGICYSVYFYKEFMAPNENIKMLGINGTMPSYDTIQSREYVYTTEVYAAVRKDLDEESKAYELFEWLQSSEGQAVVKESGYVPIS